MVSQSQLKSKVYEQELERVEVDEIIFKRL